MRKSVRLSEQRCKLNKEKILELQIQSDEKDLGLEIRQFRNKGRGVITKTKKFKGDFICEYSGELIDHVTAKERDEKYSGDTNNGCFLYFFTWGERKFCIDSTEETGKYGRLLNHSMRGNCITKRVVINGTPRLILIARKDIMENEELTYNYGDTCKESRLAYPWLSGKEERRDAVSSKQVQHVLISDKYIPYSSMDDFLTNVSDIEDIMVSKVRQNSLYQI